MAEAFEIPETQEDQQQTIVPYRHDNTLKRANVLIEAKHRASTLEQQVNFLGQLKCQQGEYTRKNDGFYVDLPASYIKEQIGAGSGSFYTRLKQIAVSIIAGYNIGIIDDERQEFKFISFINMAEYKNGVLTLRYPLEAEPLLLNGANGGFTPLKCETIMKLKKHSYSSPLYQLLREECFYPASYKGAKNYVFAKTMGVAELKFSLGLVDMNGSSEVRSILMGSKGTAEDYERALSKAKDQVYPEWSEFERRCLKKAVEEINEKSDIYVEYKKKTKGYGGKVYAVEFIIYLNGSEKNFKNHTPVSIEPDGERPLHISEDDKLAFSMKMAMEVLGELKLPYTDIIAISEAAEYNEEEIRQAVELLKQTNHVKSITGWLISCIKKKYQQPIEQRQAQSSKKTKQSAMMAHSYRSDDMMELEKALLQKNLPY